MVEFVCIENLFMMEDGFWYETIQLKAQESLIALGIPSVISCMSLRWSPTYGCHLLAERFSTRTEPRL